MQFRPATDTDADAWQAFLATSPSGDFLHDWAWADVAAYDGQPQRRFLLAEDGVVVAIAAAQQRRLPLGRSFWYVPHGPVLDWSSDRAGPRLRALLGGLRRAARRHGAMAVRLEPRLAARSAQLDALLGSGLRPTREVLQVAQTRIVELGDDQALLAGFDKDTRYAVRRAERERVRVETIEAPDHARAIDDLHNLVIETQRRGGFPLPRLERYRIAWRALASVNRAALLEARRDGLLLASGMVVIEGDRSFYLFSGSSREEPGEPKHYASYALQWSMMRHARERGVRTHDLWGVAPAGAGPEHAWYGVGLFKKGFGGLEVRWAGSWDLVVDPILYRLRSAAGMLRAMVGEIRGRRTP